MAILNRSTLKQKISDFINRVAPFSDPLIQKSEDLEIRNDVADSVIFKDSTLGSISAPGANFNVDFSTNDEYNINTAASIGSAFVITLQNLRNNSVGKLNITKKTGDTFSFANGVFSSNVLNVGQQGFTTVSFIVYKLTNGYFVFPLLNNTNEQVIVSKIINIGDWNMNANFSVNVPHGFINNEWQRIVAVDVIIRRDDLTSVTVLEGINSGVQKGGVGAINNTNIVLFREGGPGIFDSSNYQNTGFNRGFIKIQYKLA